MQRKRRAIPSDSDGTVDAPNRAPGWLERDPGLSQCIYDGLRRAVEAWWLRCIDLHEAIVDAQSGKGSQNMFDQSDLGGLTSQRGPALGRGHSLNARWNLLNWAKIGADKDNPARRRRRQKTQPHRSTGQETDSG
jgi:hypothetical protein